MRATIPKHLKPHETAVYGPARLPLFGWLVAVHQGDAPSLPRIECCDHREQVASELTLVLIPVAFHTRVSHCRRAALSLKQIHYPAAPDMLASASTVRQDVLVRAAGVFQDVGRASFKLPPSASSWHSRSCQG
jgi:hypothetical protein